ncbi:hypothetical protein [Hymenobacter jeollabukensis]|uniref:Uncharacterized protein n=1 Tax=Hymenobacter jeollabukensis TaxID=2025313 RepID=A0A5R8WKT4_9BACT|nr:hypothetical protein [Hymenobacter jeollabukensis]TLM89553.1 hypothetical protein FDY95_21005 [Hymenobacter jeollabukensis]
MLARETWPAEDAERLLERAQLVFRSLGTYQPTYLRQYLTAARSLRFNAFLRTPLLAEVEVFSTPPAAAAPATVHLSLLEGDQYVLQQQLLPGDIASRLAQYYAAALPR